MKGAKKFNYKLSANTFLSIVNVELIRQDTNVFLLVLNVVSSKSPDVLSNLH
jgi:hypothetical protein